MYLLTVLWLTLKRITHNWRITFGSLFGLVLATGIISSIPIYSSGSLQRSFIKEWVSRDSFRPPMAIIVSHRNAYRKLPVSYDDLEGGRSFIETRLNRMIDNPLESSVVFSRIGSNPIVPGNTMPDMLSPKADLTLTTNLESLCEIIAGRWYESRDDDTVEVVVDESTFERLELLIGDTYTYWYPVRNGETPQGANNGYVQIPIEVVGMFRAKAGFTTIDWIYPPPYSDRLFVDPLVYQQQLLSTYRLRALNYDVQWVFDYTATKVGDLPRLIDGFDRLEEGMSEVLPETNFWHAPHDFFRDFNERRNLISRFLTALAIPVVGMIIYYLVLMASISVEQRKREIVIMSSRGGGRLHIVSSFLLEWLILGVVAILIGPFLGMFIARVMGASSGFLEFVDRTAVPAHFDRQAVLFSIAVVLFATIAGMLPVFGVFRHSIVTYTRHYARFRRRTVWHRFFLDFVFLALAAFGYNSLRWESFALAPGQNVPADPVLFFVPVVAILGVALLVLRIYPLLVHLLRWITRSVPGIVWRLAIQRLSRSTIDYVPLMLLLAVTLSLGIYSATTARTLAVNLEDTIHYEIGADLSTVEEWVDPDGYPDGFVQTLREPPFLGRIDIPGVESAARVFRGNADLRRTERWSQRIGAQFMAIEPYEFAMTAWYRNDFGAADFSYYLKAMSEHREGIIVATPIFERAELEIGEALFVVYNGQEIPVYVIGHVEFWSGIDPFKQPFFIMNIDHFQDYTALEPYEVWYKLRDEAEIEKVVDGLTSLGGYITEYRHAESEIFDMKREPYRMGFFGMLGLGFVCSAIVTALGFFLHTFFALRRRTVQFGALRSMGLMPVQLAMLLAIELLFTVGIGIALGLGLGIGSASVFLPFLQYRTSDLNAAPPFILVMNRGDIYVSLIVIGGLFVAAVASLSALLSRMKIHRAIKLGEES